MEKNLKEIGESSSTSAASLLPVHLLELHLLSPPNLGQNQARILTLMLLVGYGCVHRGFKALKQSTKLLYCVLLRPQEALKTYIELLSYTTSAVTRNCEQAPSVLSYLRSKKPARSASEVGAGELIESLSPPFLASSSSSSFTFLPLRLRSLTRLRKIHQQHPRLRWWGRERLRSQDGFGDVGEVLRGHQEEFGGE